MKYALWLSVVFCVPCNAADFRWGRYEPVPWVPEQAAAQARFVMPPSAPVFMPPKLPTDMTRQATFQCKGCPIIKLPPAPK